MNQLCILIVCTDFVNVIRDKTQNQSSSSQ